MSSHKTANDIPFLLIHIPDAKHISIKAAWDSDWAYRSEVNQVVPYVGTKLILQGGAVGYPAAEAGEIFADLKAQAHLYPTADHVIGDLTFPRASLLKIQKLIEAHLKAPLFDPIWFQRVRDQLQKSLQEEKAKPNHAGFDAIRWAALGEHS
ncbi:MAG: hypothetical protein OIF54_02910, partial [Cohaesibacter sp.]|nr:hypothetical protein [Cohaesibacter sp.]